MSTNNQLVILKNKELFEVHENLCVDNTFHPTKQSLLGEFITLQKAIEFANKYCNEYPYVEYGYYIQDNCLK